MGYQDRGGGREGKKSLRSNKKKIHNVVKQMQASKPTYENDSGKTSAIPPPISPAAQQLQNPNPNLPPPRAHFIDAGCNLVHRQFEFDLERVLERGFTGGVDAMIVCTHFDKIETAAEFAKGRSGAVYFASGFTPDSVKRVNDKTFTDRVDKLRHLMLNPEAVALISGLDFSRDVSTYFTQEAAMKEHITLAEELTLPVIFQIDHASFDRFVEIMSTNQYREQLVGAAIYNFMGTESMLDWFIEMDFHICVTGAICDATESGQQLRELLHKIPLDRLIVASDSPYFTPQNIDDDYIRQEKNEPSNLPFVYEMIAAELRMSLTEVAEKVYENTRLFYRIPTQQEAEELRQITEQQQQLQIPENESNEAEQIEEQTPEANNNSKKKAKSAKKNDSKVTDSGSKKQKQQKKKQQANESENDTGEDSSEPEMEEDIEMATIKQGKSKKANANKQKQQKVAAVAVANESDAEEEAVADIRPSSRKQKRGKKSNNQFNSSTAHDSGDNDNEKEPIVATTSKNTKSSQKESKKAEKLRKQEEKAKNRKKGKDSDSDDQNKAATATQSFAPITSTKPRRAVNHEEESDTMPRRPHQPSQQQSLNSQQAIEWPTAVDFACKICRVKLFSSTDIIPHEVETHALASASTSQKSCNAYFIRPQPWIATEQHVHDLDDDDAVVMDDDEDQGKLECHKCEAKLGRISTAGTKCSCGYYVSPAIQVLKRRVDVIIPLQLRLLLQRVNEQNNRALEQQQQADDSVDDTVQQSAAIGGSDRSESIPAHLLAYLRPSVEADNAIEDEDVDAAKQKPKPKKKKPVDAKLKKKNHFRNKDYTV